MKRILRLLLPVLAVASLSACNCMETITVCNKKSPPSCWEIQR